MARDAARGPAAPTRGWADAACGPARDAARGPAVRHGAGAQRLPRGRRRRAARRRRAGLGALGRLGLRGFRV